MEELLLKLLTPSVSQGTIGKCVHCNQDTDVWYSDIKIGKVVFRCLPCKEREIEKSKILTQKFIDSGGLDRLSRNRRQ